MYLEKDKPKFDWMMLTPVQRKALRWLEEDWDGRAN